MARTATTNRAKSYGRSRDDRQEGKKHSGATTGYTKGGAPYTTGWNYSKRFGLVSIGCFTYKGTKETVSASGTPWLNVMVKITKPMATPALTSGLMDARTGRVIIKDLGLVINPKAPNGGYCGRYGK